jgi:protease-4
VLRSLFRIVEMSARLVVSLAILALVFLLLLWSWPEDGPTVAESTALVIAPRGLLVEQETGYPAQRVLLELMGRPVDPETTMRPLLEAISRARDDERVKVLALDLNRLGGGGLSKLQDLKLAIEEFQESGKPVVAFSDMYFQSQYYLASLADEVFVHPMGMVLLQGYGTYRQYYREALDKIDARWNIFRVGRYKSAVEPYLLSGMSDDAREARSDWLGDLWNTYRNDVAAARELEPIAVESYVEEYHLRLEARSGDAAQLALDAGLVDNVAARDEVKARLVELAGEDDETGSYNRIGHLAYLSATEGESRDGEGVVGVVIAKGPIVDGRQPPGSIGGDSTAALIRGLREDDDVKAVVLRVDSPGGSAFASEIIRREVELTREAGKPVVASMGSVAASGGYWISMSADQIWARESTITGSIGIYAMFPTFEKSFERLGVRMDGVGTHPLAGASRVDRDLPEEAATALQLLMNKGYNDFITKAAEGRGMEVDEVDRLAQGRVWSGGDALDRGLVDAIGGLDEAIAAAAELAELEDDHRVRYVEEQPSRSEQLLSWFLLKARPLLGDGPLVRADPLSDNALVRGLRADLAALLTPGKPYQALAYCFCEYE